MPSFDKYTNYNENAGVSGVVFGHKSNVLEVEMNEMQEIQKTMLRRTIRSIMGDGVTDLSKVVYEDGKVKIKSGCAIAVEGYLIDCDGLETTMSNGTAYVQVWEDTVGMDAQLKENGNQQKGNVSNYIKDSRVGVETTRRKVLKFTLAPDIADGRKCLAVAKVEDGKMNKLCKEVNLAKLNDRVIDLQVQMGTFGDGVLGVEVDLENNTFRRVGDNENWSAGDDYTNGSDIYGKRTRVNVTDEGVVVAKWGDEAYTETGALTKVVAGINGVSYPVGTKVQSMVMQPRYYYKRIPLKVIKQSGTNVKGFHLIKWVDLISPVYRDGFKEHPAFMKGADQLDYYFIGENDGCIETSGAYDTTDTGTLTSSPYTGQKFSSIANAKPASGTSKSGTGNKTLTRDAVRKLCANRGTDFMQFDITIASSEQMLFLIEYATFNMQALPTFGEGVTNMAWVDNTNDSVPCPNNTSLGNKSGKIAVNYTHSNGTAYALNIPVYRGVKNPFGNIWKFCDGFLRKHSAAADCNEAFWQDGSKAFSDAIADYIACGFSCATAGGYVKAFGYSEDCDFMYMTSLVGGDSNKPVGDYYWVNMDTNALYIALFGAGWSSGLPAGVFCWRLDNVASGRYYDIGGRLCRKSKTVTFATNM